MVTVILVVAVLVAVVDLLIEIEEGTDVGVVVEKLVEEHPGQLTLVDAVGSDLHIEAGNLEVEVRVLDAVLIHREAAQRVVKIVSGAAEDLDHLTLADLLLVAIGPA